MHATPIPRSRNSALASRNYLTYLIGNTISLHGLWIYRVALGWYAWELSQSEFWVGVVAFTQFVPAVVFGPVFGVLADRFDRRAASMLINTMSLFNMLVLGVLAYMGKVDVVVLALLAFMQGTLDGAHMPVRMSIVPNLVKKAQLESAIAFTSISFNISRFVGPALAGLIIATLGVGWAFAINGLSYLALIVAMMVVQLNPSAQQRKRSRHVGRELLAGLRYTFSHTRIRALLIIVAIAALFARGILELMPAIADGLFAGGSSALAMLTSAVGAGAIVAGLVLSRNVAWLSINAIRVAVMLSGLLITTIGLFPLFSVAMVCVVLLGALLSFAGVGSQILIQTLVEDEVRGRVSSLWGVLTFGGTALGSLLAGMLASFWGLATVIAVVGAGCGFLAMLSTGRMNIFRLLRQSRVGKRSRK